MKAVEQQLQYAALSKKRRLTAYLTVIYGKSHKPNAVMKISYLGVKRT